MTIYQLKPRFQALLRPVVRSLHGVGATANGVTVAALALSLLAGLALAAGPHPAVWLLLPAVLLVRMALNAIDGMLAREHDQRSDLGALLNELGDVASDAALYLPFATLPHFPPWSVAIVVLLAALTEFAGVLGQTIGGDRRYEGPLGKSDRALLFGALGLAIGLGMGPAPWLTALFPALSVLLLLTLVRRCRGALRAASPRA